MAYFYAVKTAQRVVFFYAKWGDFTTVLIGNQEYDDTVRIMQNYQPTSSPLNSNAPALIVASPGRIRDGLKTMLRAIPRIENVLQANDGPAAIKIITEYHPVLVLLDSHLANNDIQSVSRQIKAKSPHTRCIMLVDNARQQWMAKVADADRVLTIGCPAGEFFAAIEGLLPWPEIEIKPVEQVF
jgi:CheY-like chemotaxis protein